MGVNRLASIWGLAEATFFFIVPDVWLSIAGRNNLRTGLIACVYSLLGALVGGCVMWAWGRYDSANTTSSAIAFISQIPAINSEMIHRVNHQLNEVGLMSMFLGPLSGTPYKIYATQAGQLGMSVWLFVLISIPARLIRFVMVTVFFHYALKLVNRVVSEEHNIKILLVSWTGFYMVYFFSIS